METLKFETDVTVFYVTAVSFPDRIKEAFDRLDELVAGTGERTYYGLSKPSNGVIVYKAAVKEAYPGEGGKYGCETMVLTRGTYLAETIPAWRQRVGEIGAVFEKLLSDPRLDPSSFCVECYQGEDVRCMVKLKD